VVVPVVERGYLAISRTPVEKRRGKARGYISTALKTPVWRPEGVYEYIHESALMFTYGSAYTVLRIYMVASMLV